MGRAPCCSKVGLKRGPWTAREDTLLKKYIEKHGEGQWKSLPKKAGLLRCGKSCRLRWMNYLRPNIKRGNIEPEEEELIIKLHALLGNRWSLIAGRLPGRTDNEIKNYWNTHLSKILKRRGIDPRTHKPLPLDADDKDPNASTSFQKKLESSKTPIRDPMSNNSTKIHLPKASRVTTPFPLLSRSAYGMINPMPILKQNQDMEPCIQISALNEDVIRTDCNVSNVPSFASEAPNSSLMDLSFPWPEYQDQCMIYEGDLLGEVNEEFLELVRFDGWGNIAESVSNHCNLAEEREFYDNLNWLNLMVEGEVNKLE